MDSLGKKLAVHKLDKVVGSNLVTAIRVVATVTL